VTGISVLCDRRNLLTRLGIDDAKSSVAFVGDEQYAGGCGARRVKSLMWQHG